MAETNDGNGLPEASLVESVQFVVAGLLPSLVRGLFSPRRGAMKLLTAVNADARATQVLRGIRDKHGGQGAKLLGGRIVTLWGGDAIKEVLDRSADVYDSGAGAKAKGMSHFQPDALTLSHGDEWKDRRKFAESVLATSETVHPDAQRFLDVVADEVQQLRLDGELTYDRFEQLFDRITLRVIFGDRARDDQELTELLEKLMGEANRLVGLSDGDPYYEFYGHIERRLRDPEPGSLIAHIASAPHSDTTRVTHQIPHWMFAMRDTLGSNTYRALALCVSSPDVEQRVREDIAGGDLSDPSFVAGLNYLEGVLQEAMRLWPTVPLLARETTRDTELAGAKLDEGTQVMILNTFNHRDVDDVPDANRLNPERWMNGNQRNPKFNHLSGGTQYCPGIPLVLLLGKAVIGRLLEAHRLRLEQPQLDAGGDLPHMLDFFDVRFSVEGSNAH
jgi:cytochrome P450